MKELRALKTISVILLLLGLVSNTWAAGYFGLQPTSPTRDLVNDQTVNFDVIFSFQADGGTLGGGFDVVFDPTALEFVGLTSAGLGDPAFGRDPDILPGRLSSWAIGDFNGISSGVVGSMQFKVLATHGATTVVGVIPTDGIAGPWVSAANPVSTLEPDYIPNDGFVGVTFADYPISPTTYQYNGTVTYCLPDVCDDLVALKVGSLVEGTVDIATSPLSVFDSSHVGPFSYTITNPDLPVTPSDPPPEDAEANPLYVFYVNELDNNAVDIGTFGLTDNNNLFTAGMAESSIQVSGGALQGYIFQDLASGTGCFNGVLANYCGQDISAVIWEGGYTIKESEEVFADGFE